MNRICEQLLDSFPDFSRDISATFGFVIIFLGSAMAREKVANERHLQGSIKAIKSVGYVDPFTGTPLEGMGVEIHTDWPSGCDDQQVVNNIRAILGKCSKALKRPFKVFVVGAGSTYSDASVARDPTNPRQTPPQLAGTITRKLIGFVTLLRNSLDSDVHYLGTGLTPDHPTRASMRDMFWVSQKFLHEFWVRSVSTDEQRRSARLFYLDLYSPATFDGCRWLAIKLRRREEELLVEPDRFVSEFKHKLVHYILIHCCPGETELNAYVQPPPPAPGSGSVGYRGAGSK